MEEHRRFFRIQNDGHIHAIAGNESLEVVNISSAGILVIKKKENFCKEGILGLYINNFSMYLHYEILKIEQDNMVLIFKGEDEIEELLIVLKKLRDESHYQL